MMSKQGALLALACCLTFVSVAQAQGLSCYVSSVYQGLPTGDEVTNSVSTATNNTFCSQTWVHYRYPLTGNPVFATYDGWLFNASSADTLSLCASTLIAQQQTTQAYWSTASLGSNVFWGFQQTTCCNTANCNNPNNVPFTNSQARLVPSHYALLLVTLLAAVLLKVIVA